MSLLHLTLLAKKRQHDCLALHFKVEISSLCSTTSSCLITMIICLAACRQSLQILSNLFSSLMHSFGGCNVPMVPTCVLYSYLEHQFCFLIAGKEEVNIKKGSAATASLGPATHPAHNSQASQPTQPLETEDGSLSPNETKPKGESLEFQNTPKLVKYAAFDRFPTPIGLTGHCGVTTSCFEHVTTSKRHVLIGSAANRRNKLLFVWHSVD